MIKSISFLTSDSEREHVSCIRGKFYLKQKRTTRGQRAETRSFTAVGFVDFVRNRDPFITLKSGEKLRVYRGGDPKDEVIETISIVETHDKKYNRKSTPDYEDLLGMGW